VSPHVLCRQAVILLSVLCSASLALAQPRWVTVGQASIQWHYMHVFRLSLQVPYGQTNIQDIKDGLVPLRFTLSWLPPHMSQEKVAAYFTESLQKHFSSDSDFVRNRPRIERFLRSLPATHKHDLWHIEYDPDAGTLIFIGDHKVHHLVGASLNRALLDTWLDDNPVTTAQLLSRLIQRQSLD